MVAIAVCALMGLWQLGVYGSKHDDAAKSAQSAKPVDILKVWGPDDPFTEDLLNCRVRIEGDPQDIFVVKRPDGQKWYAATMRIRGTESSLLVVLGHWREVIDLTVPRRLTAVLRPPESTGDLSIARRVNQSSGDLFSGYALMDSPGTGLKPVTPPDPQVSWTVGLRNLAYALQWWVFGLFAAFMWWRMVTDALEVEQSVADSQVP